MIRRLLICTLFLAGCSSTPGPGGTTEEKAGYRYSGEAGESPVGVIPDVVLRDETRARDVVLTVEYPTRGTAHPVIVFSHGFGGSHRDYTGLSSHWASHGYVVIRPKHADAGGLRALSGPEEIWASQTAADWAGRVRDVAFVIESLERLEQRYPELAGRMDRARVGVGGHSYGAHTAMLIGGARTFPGGVSHADARVKAVIAMSPQGPAPDRGLTAESFAGLNLPVLFMTGSRDGGISEAETPAWRREAFVHSAAGDKWFVSIEGARHLSFTGRVADLLERRVDVADPFARERTVQQQPRGGRAGGAASRQREIFDRIRSLSLAFWDASLRGDAAGREALEKAAERGGVIVERK